jgi:hypothetical protein
LRLTWLAVLAFLPQWLAFYFSVTRRLIPDYLAVAALVGSQALFLVFAWFNRNQPGFWLLGLGLALNLLVITLNGGLMPISPETVAQLVPDALPRPGRSGTGWGRARTLSCQSKLCGCGGSRIVSCCQPGFPAGLRSAWATSG